MGKSKTGLMLVEDPEDTIKTLCMLKKGSITKKIYKKTYEELKNLDKPIHEKSADTHFYTLSIYKLIVPNESAPKGVYKISNVGTALCESLEKDNKAQFQKMLSTILQNNPDKGELFKSFLSFVRKKNKRTKNEVYNNFKNIPGRTLIAWTKSAGLIESNIDLVWALPSRPPEIIKLEQFEKELIETYRKLSSTPTIGLENLFVEIAEIRQIICIRHSWAIEIFDDYLRELIDTPFGEKIRLYGAPSSTFTKENEFVQNNKSYIYIRLKV